MERVSHKPLGQMRNARGGRAASGFRDGLRTKVETNDAIAFLGQKDPIVAKPAPGVQDHALEHALALKLLDSGLHLSHVPWNLLPVVGAALSIHFEYLPLRRLIVHLRSRARGSSGRQLRTQALAHSRACTAAHRAQQDTLRYLDALREAEQLLEVQEVVCIGENHAAWSVPRRAHC